MYKFAYSVLLAFVLLSAQSFAKAYKLVDPAGMSEEPEVIEFFSYTCPVCYRLEQPLTGWKKGCFLNLVLCSDVPPYRPYLGFRMQFPFIHAGIVLSPSVKGLLPSGLTAY